MNAKKIYGKMCMVISCPSVLVLLLLVTVFTNSDLHAQTPDLICFNVHNDTEVTTVAGVLQEESDDFYTVFDIRTHKTQKIPKGNVHGLKRHSSEQDIVNFAGIAPTVSHLISLSLPRQPGTGRIVSIDASVAYTNLGEDSGIKPGDKLKVYRKEGDVLDPETGEVLGAKESRIAVLDVLEVQKRLSKVKLTAGVMDDLKVGDSVRSPSSEQPVAVLPFPGISESLRRKGLQISEEMITSLTKNNVTVVERILLIKALRELSFSESTFFDTQSAKKVGSLLQAHAVVVGTVQLKENTPVFNVRLIETESGKVLYATTVLEPNFSSASLVNSSKPAVPVPAMKPEDAQGSTAWGLTRSFSQGGGARAIAFSPDGQFLASGHVDKAVRLWNLSSGKVLNVSNGHSNYVRCIDFSPDGERIVSGSIDNTANIWSASNGRRISTLLGHDSYVKDTKFSPDGSIVATASWDRTIKLWSAHNGRLISTFQRQSHLIEGLAFSPDGTRLASADFDNLVRIWSVPDGQIIKTLAGHTDDVCNVAFSADGQLLASTSKDGTIRLWSMPAGKLINTLVGHVDEVCTVAFHLNGQMIASGSNDKTVKVWSIPDGRLITTLHGHSDRVWEVAFSPDGKSLASCSRDAGVKFWAIPVSYQTAR